MGSDLWRALLCLDGESTFCRDLGCSRRQGLAGHQRRDLLQSQIVLHEEPDDTPCSSHHRNTLQRHVVSLSDRDPVPTCPSLKRDGSFSPRAGGSTAGSPCSCSRQRRSKVTPLFSTMKPTSWFGRCITNRGRARCRSIRPTLLVAMRSSMSSFDRICRTCESFLIHVDASLSLIVTC